MENIKLMIEERLAEVECENALAREALSDRVLLTDYSPSGDSWTAALQRALDEHEIVVIPASEKHYLIDGTVILPSDRQIIAEDGAVIRLAAECKTLMLRNFGTVDGTHRPITGDKPCRDITISGGVWAESATSRGGYGRSGKYDDERSLYGVSTCMFFENMERLTLRDMTFMNCAGFAVQLGRISNVIIENIKFVGCFADGIHINGDTENIRVSNITGQVGDDLVAFNMYDWLDSSVNFGPLNNAICENIRLDDGENTYPAIRLQAGIYTFDDGSKLDCSLNNAIFRRFGNIRTFKMYCQTPRYEAGTMPERGDVGSGSHLFFEDMDIDLTYPIDRMQPYMQSDPITGSFAAFELGMNIDSLYFRDIRLTLHRDIFPYSYLVCIGPKSVRSGKYEIFDPNFSSHVENMYFENITINGERVEDIAPYVREIHFDGLYDDIPSSGKGTIGRLITR